MGFEATFLVDIKIRKCTRKLLQSAEVKWEIKLKNNVGIQDYFTIVGSIGFTVAGGIPKVGQLLNAAWNITDVCRFKIIQPPKRPKLPELPREKDKQKEEYDSASMPPPPSPASSTCSDGSMNMSRR